MKRVIVFGMNSNSYLNFYPSIQICSLEAAREADHSLYDGVITIEDSFIETPLRVKKDVCPQLVLRFDDITLPVDDWVEPSIEHIKQAFGFSETIKEGSLLVHCTYGISRSSAIALSIIARGLGEGREKDAVKELQQINPYCAPNALIVWLTDELLNRNGKLYKTTESQVNLTGTFRGH